MNLLDFCVPPIMTRLFFAILLSTTALLAAAGGQHSYAAPSKAEVFWCTVLPDTPLPDAILWFLRPDFVGEANREGAANWPPPLNTGSVSGYSPFLYRYQPSPASTGVSKYVPFLYNDYHPSPTRTRLSKVSPFTYIYDPTPQSNRPVKFFMKLAKSLRRWSSPNLAGDDDGAVFFHVDAARVGHSLPIHFPPARRAPLGLLPRHVADSMLFSKQALPDVLARLGIAAGSTLAADMEKTLQMCEASPSLAGEAKFCATSLEALVEGAMAALGTRDVTPVTSTLPRNGAPLQRYIVRAVRPVDGTTFVACHDMEYPYTVYMCHGTGPARAYLLDMEGAVGGGVVNAAIVCHTDTSRWSPEHVSFKMLGTKPGGSPMCHVMPYGHIIWAKNNATSCSSV